MLRSLLFLSTVLSAPLLAQENVVLIVADDLGVDLISTYGEGASPACTPQLDQLASTGVLFRNAWAAPSCTPMRASLMTGKHPFRTQIGMPGLNGTLPLSELALPEALVGYDTAAIGKWHLGGGGPAAQLHPNNTGFDHYSGALGGAVSDYDDWTRTTDGVQTQVTEYATRVTTDDAIVALANMQAPWFLYVSYNAPHTPFHFPPLDLCDCGTLSFCDAQTGNNASRAKAMVEALDGELGRLTAAARAIDPDCVIIFVGDNGTAPQAVEAPFIPGRAKNTVYEGGLNVPMIFNAPARFGSFETPALASTTDLFATILELAGERSVAPDSISLVPVLERTRRHVRDTVFGQRFTPNGPGPYTEDDRAVRDDRYKLIRTLTGDELYDLQADPFEATDLLPGLTPASREWPRYQELVTVLTKLGVE